jgi:hypothetical protein
MRMTSQLPCPERHRRSLIFAVLLLFSPLGQIAIRSQGTAPQFPADDSTSPSQILRLEKVQVPGGSELITIQARLVGIDSGTGDSWVPLVSILRDNLGDVNPENDKLRYVWPLTYTRPTMRQRLAAAIPFLYARVGNKNKVSENPPPPAFDLAAPENEVWEKIFWTALQNILLDPYGTPVKASTSSYRRNASDYRKSHIIRALSVLALYQEVNGQTAFSDAEMAEIQARLMLSDKTFGGLVDDLNLQTYYAKKVAQSRDERGHNWELLRQKAEADSLHFQPLMMPDGSASHAIIWVAKRDLQNHQGSRYDGRFLNIANPWTDKRLLQWQGYVETRYFDSQGQPVTSDTPGAQATEIIPLALYGLDNPKIPSLLVDFRDGYNPKKREMSRRVLNDVTRNLLSISKFGNLPFFLSRTVFDFVTGRRGMDINQPSRLQTYSQLKLLLALTNSMQPELQNEVNDRLEKISLNPFENSIQAEAKVAKIQYQALLAFAKDPQGLAAKIDRDRRAEMTPLQHGRSAQFAFRMAHILTFGKYVHREDPTEDMEERLDVARRVTYHTRFLERVAKSKSEIDIAWDLEEVDRSLRFIADHGTNAGSSAVSATVKIFARTRNIETRRSCLESLSRIHNPRAQTELTRISQNKEVDESLRDIAVAYLRQVVERSQPIASTADTPAKGGQP